MGPDTKRLTYRVRRLPVSINVVELRWSLQNSLKSLNEDPKVEVFSLARSIGTIDPYPSKVATITIDPLPQRFQGKPLWYLPLEHGGTIKAVTVDCDFFDLTVLNDVEDHELIVNLVAVSGLASHPFGSWQQPRSENRTNFMWLRDGVPKHLRGVRVIIYGYDTSLLTQSFKNSEDLAQEFVKALLNAGLGDAAAKPTIFLGHSLGGIILKEAIMHLWCHSDQAEALLGKIKACLGFGVPHDGMQTKQLLSMVSGRYLTETLVEALSYGSQHLKYVDFRYKEIQKSKGFRVISFFETKPTPTVQESSPGKWTRTGSEVTMVEKASAIHRCSRLPEDVHHIDKNHSEMVKFAMDDAGYTAVCRYLSSINEGIQRDAIIPDEDARLNSLSKISRPKAWSQKDTLGGRHQNTSNGVTQHDNIPVKRSHLLQIQRQIRPEGVNDQDTDSPVRRKAQERPTFMGDIPEATFYCCNCGWGPMLSSLYIRCINCGASSCSDCHWEKCL